MANTRVSDLTAGGAFADTDLLYVVETAGTGGVKKTGSQIAEYIRDTVAALIVGGSNIGEVYDDGADTLTISFTGTIYTDEDAQDAVGAIVDSTLTYVANTSLGVANGGIDTPQLADDAVDADKIDGADAAAIRTLLGLTSIVLQAYEEGTYTPTVAFATPGTSSFSYTTQFGMYTRIGNQVITEAFLNFTPTLGSASGALRISIPFTSAASSFGAGVLRSINSAFMWGGGTDLVVAAQSSAAYITLRADASGAGVVEFGPSNMTDGVGHNFSFSMNVRLS